MKSHEVRSAFLNYFKKQGHSIVESSSLVPHNDPTLLFTNAGMNQFKDVFTGAETRPYKRATTSQKCVRAGGKHNDLENVGYTDRHHTFFEMLGNFSFGDYFKKEAIHFAWEFVTKDLQLPKDRLYVSVFRDDDEAADIWHKQEGVPRDRIYRFGEKDNFWAMGETGPCGPCSEIFIDRGPQFGSKRPDASVENDGDRFMEFWNLVFMQFNRSADGKMEKLPKPSVDTGAGLERVSLILQNAETNYDTDLFQGIIQKTAALAKKHYEPRGELRVPFRVIADHSRAAAFLIGDGVLPSNEGRGYVLRRIIRRAVRYGQRLGFEKPFLHTTAGYVIDQMKGAYPDLASKRTFIERALQAEEEQFFKTLERGLSLLEEASGRLSKGGVLSGDVAFKLYDTFGFPLDLTTLICREKGFTVDEAGFDRAMETQREGSRKNWKGSGEEAVDAKYLSAAESLRSSGITQNFVGYEKLSAEGKCLWVSNVSGPESKGEIEAIFDTTPFYGESGGQAGDRGSVESSSFRGQVVDVQKPNDLIVVRIKPVSGALKVGDKVKQTVEGGLRALTARNHTATHLLHWALRKTLGDHVKQAGSLVNSELLRFDFTHFQPLTAQELDTIEDMINEKVWSNDGVQKRNMTKDAALAAGAIAFFGEKYGDEVRVVSVGDYSTELCGGTHVDRSGDIHLFKIGNENGIAAGVRRIIAYTSKGAFDYLKRNTKLVGEMRDLLKASSAEEIIPKIQRTQAVEKDLRKQIEKLQGAAAGQVVKQLTEQTKDLGGYETLALEIKAGENPSAYLRELGEQLKARTPKGIFVLLANDTQSSKVFLLAACGAEAMKKVPAGTLVQKLAPLISGKGGGKPDLAQAGGSDPSGIKKVIESFAPTLQSLLQ